MTTVVGIFDDAWNVEKAIEQLAAAGFEDTVYDEAIVAEQPDALGTIRPVRAPDSAPDKVLGADAPNSFPSRTGTPLSKPLRLRPGHRLSAR